MSYRHLSIPAMLLLLTAACASAGTQQGSAGQDQNPITLEEIEASGAANAFDLVQVRRPGWLRMRGTQSFHEGARGVGGGTGADAAVSATPGQTPIIVYMDAARLGGPEMLRQIDIRTIGAVEYLNRAAADYRFGPGHLHGAIILRPRS